MSNKKIIGITGSTGLLGRTFIKENNKFKFDRFKGRVENKNHIRKWLKNKKFDALLHLAAIVPTDIINNNYKKAIDTNFIGTKNLINEILNNKMNTWFFFSSTSHVYKPNKYKLSENSKRKPYSKYGKTKFLAENFLFNILKKKKLKICIGRIFSITHPKQKKYYVVPMIYSKIKKHHFQNEIIFKNLNHDRDFCHLNDLCNAIAILIKKKSTGVYNIASGKKTNLKFIAKYYSKRKKIKFVDNLKKTVILANISKIRKIGFKPKYRINNILADFKK